MASIYIHIPFCKQKCHYCNFFTTVSLKNREFLIQSIITEISQKANYLKGDIVDSIYFGGGTPSLLTVSELKSILETCSSVHHISDDCEITLEANPDDISHESLLNFKLLGINRLSIGIQSFNDDILQKLNRIHTAKVALDCIYLAKSYGFNNMNIDLIYGIPGLEMELWKKELQLFFSLDIPHLSAYFLTVEPKTALAVLIKKNKYPLPVEEEGLAHFEVLTEFMKSEGYLHYEISNFSKPNQLSRHNSNYWKHLPYVGIGPSAHSFNLVSRQWNVGSISKYIDNINSEITYSGIEFLSEEERYNEYVMLGLRTSWGIDLNWLENNVGIKFKNYLLDRIENSKFQSYLVFNNNSIILSPDGKKLADGIASDLFIDINI